MMGGYGGYGGWGMGLHSIFWLVILALIVWAVVAFTRSNAGRTSGSLGHNLPGPRSNGLAILEERYAKGEIDREEYQQKKRDLTS
ncbi:MAG: SHOCT domain-containing protein [Beijerinckiaceae bacterium]